MSDNIDQSVRPASTLNGVEDRRVPLLRAVVDRVQKLGYLFMVTVLLPTSVAILYLGLFASDVYTSESRFVVRTPEKPATSGLGFLLKSAGFANAGDEVYAAQDYVKSRDALAVLDHGGAFRRAYGTSSIFFFDRFGTSLSGRKVEDLYRYYSGMVKVNYDSATAITTLTVRAYDPVSARKFNERLLEMAEATVNRLNERGRQDLIRFASTEVSDAKKQATDAAIALSSYRNQQGVVDPERQANVQLQMISKLQDELIATRTQLLELRSFTPRNPQISVLEARAAGTARAIDEQVGLVAGGRRSLSSAAVKYQRLSLESQLADKQLASAMASLAEASNEARRKQAYVERIVQPNLPDEALEPRRWRGVLATLALGLVAWGILTMLFAGVREHQG